MVSWLSLIPTTCCLPFDLERLRLLDIQPVLGGTEMASPLIAAALATL